MCCFEDALDNCIPSMPTMMPMDWLDPYGDMPLSKGMEAKIDIQVTETDDGIHVTSVKTPPRTGNIRLSEVIESLMGSYMTSPCAADQAKCSETDTQKSVPQNEESDTDDQKDDMMKLISSSSSKEQGSQPWDDEKPDEQKSHGSVKDAEKDHQEKR